MTTTLHLFTGKGGVGKTTLATAWAMAAAKQGKRVLLAELYGGARISALLELEPTGYRQILLQPNLWYIDITPWEALKEYAQLTLKIPLISNALADHPLIQAFLQVIPGLGEMVLWGKLWYHTQEHERDEVPYDMLIIDAPATGHAKALLQTPAMVRKAIPLGPMQRHAQHIEQLLLSPQTFIHVVATDEELPITEACELISFCQQYRLQVGHVWMNQINPPILPQTLHQLGTLANHPYAASTMAYLQQYAQSVQQGLAERDRFTALYDKPLCCIPAYPQLHPLTLCETLLPHVSPLLDTLDKSSVVQRKQT